MYQSILVPVDGSPHSHRAVQLAARLLDSSRARLYLLNVQPGPANADLLGRAADAPALQIDEAAEREGMQVLEQAIETTGICRAAVECDVRAGAPADTILSEAKRLDVEAIVIGSRGASELSSLILGSVAYRVLHAAEARVVLVR